jgi:hypothetical protein
MRAALGLAIAFAAGAAAGCTVAANRVALVPHAGPITNTGQPMESTGAVTLGGLYDPLGPKLGNPEVGLEIPKGQVHGELALRVTSNFSLEVHTDRGFHSGATPLKPNQPPVDGGDVSGGGMGFAYSIRTSQPGLRVGIAAQVSFWSVPFTEYRACVSNCTIDGFPITYTDVIKGSDSVSQLALAIVPSYRVGGVTYFGGLTAANHPTLIQKAIESSLDVTGDVQNGPLNLILHAGIAIDLGGGITASAYIAQDVSQDPVAYKPTLGFLLSLPLGHDAPPALAPPPPPPAPPPPAPMPSGPPGGTTF